ncbi:MAG: type II secretion system protein [Candidatus Omnitrophota bacterium]|nr:type II secretion system protein [Candidatus Omnitrophota bacterium]
MSDKKGLTLTEVIVSALIIAVLAAGLFGSFAGAQRFINRAKHRAQAYNFAMEAMDRLRSVYEYNDDPQMNITNINDDSDDHLESDIWTAIIQGDMDSENIGGTLKYDVTDPGGVSDDGYKTVTVKVRWDEPTFNTP